MPTRTRGLTSRYNICYRPERLAVTDGRDETRRNSGGLPGSREGSAPAAFSDAGPARRAHRRIVRYREPVGERAVEACALGLAADRRSGIRSAGPTRRAGRRAADAGLRRGSGRRRRRGRGASPRARTSLQSRVRRRDFLGRSVAASTYRGLRAHAEAFAAALFAGGRRRRRKDDHDGPVSSGNDRAGPSRPDPRGVPGRVGGQLGTRDAHPVPPAVRDRARIRRPQRKPVRRAGKRSRDRQHRHARDRANVRAVARSRRNRIRAALRHCRVRRSPQAGGRSRPGSLRSQD